MLGWLLGFKASKSDQGYLMPKSVRFQRIIWIQVTIPIT